jgi:hypothetical protein
MKNFVSIIFLLTTACTFKPYNEEEPFKIVGADDDIVSQLSAAVEFTKLIAPGSLDTNGYLIQVFYTIEDVTENCEYDTKTHTLLGCAVPVYRLINVEWADNYPSLNATVLAHELGHAYYYERGEGDGDFHHKHTEWFNINEQDSICNQVFLNFDAWYLRRSE